MEATRHPEFSQLEVRVLLAKLAKRIDRPDLILLACQEMPRLRLEHDTDPAQPSITPNAFARQLDEVKHKSGTMRAVSETTIAASAKKDPRREEP